MKNTYDTIARMRAVSGKNEKTAILQSQSDDADLREYLRLCYEPSVNFYQSKVPSGSASMATRVFDRALLDEVVATFAGRQLTGNAAKTRLAEINQSLATDWEQQLLAWLIGRDVKAGFGENTINKVWANTITDVPYMRCSLPKDSNLKNFPWERGVYSQIKADGMFVNVNRLDANVFSFTSRAGSPFPLEAFAEIIEELKQVMPISYQFHGELTMLRKQLSGYVTCSRQEGNGMFNSILKGGELKEGFVPKLDVWDAIPLEQATPKNKYKGVPYSERIKVLQFAIQTKFVELIPTRIVHSLKEAYEHYRWALEHELEGTVVKDPDAIWEDTTSKNQVKLKLEFAVELKITGFNAGNGKNVDLFGSIACESADGKLKTNAHGFSDELRKQLNEDKEALIGKIITVKANSIMPPTNKDYWSLFLPIFVEVRHDKREANTLEEIVAQYDASIDKVG